MIEVRDTAPGLRFLELFWAEVERQAAAAAPSENKKRDVDPSRHAHSR